MSSIKYRPEIDGLRALAILPVVAFHLGADWLPGGFVGVDVFFVISGYLITSIILKEHSAGTFTLKNFWLRRIRRIMPAMLLMLLVTTVAGYFILFGASWSLLGWQSLATLGLFANMFLWSATHNYWGPTAENMPLLHNWSLSVEEQFYLFFPLLVMVCWKWFPRKLLACLGGIFLASLALCVLVTYRSSSAAFFFLPTRAWELAGGCLLAAMHYHGVRGAHSPWVISLRLQNWLAGLGVIMIALSWFVIREAGFPGYQALLPVIGSMLVIEFAGGTGCLVTSFLAWAPIKYIGQISYSLYLWHWPVIVLGRAAQTRWENFPDWTYWLLIPILTLAAYYLVERPGRRLQNILPPVIAGIVAVAAISAGLVLTKPVYDLSRSAPTVWMGNVYDVSPRQIQNDFIKQRMDGIVQPQRDPKEADAYTRGGIVKHYGGDQVDVILIGNSHALMWAPVIDEICQESRLTVAFNAADGTPPFPSINPVKQSANNFTPEEWFNFDGARMKFIETWRPRLVIVVARWCGYTKTDENLIRFLDATCRLDCKVLFIGSPPELAIGDINAPKYLSAANSTTVKAHCVNELQQSTAMLKSLVQRYANVYLLETADLYLADSQRVKAKVGDQFLYIDDDHLSLAGARLAKDQVKHELVRILGNSVN